MFVQGTPTNDLNICLSVKMSIYWQFTDWKMENKLRKLRMAKSFFFGKKLQES